MCSNTGRLGDRVELESDTGQASEEHARSPSVTPKLPSTLKIRQSPP